MTGPTTLDATAGADRLLPRIVDHLEDGGLLACPTDTVYGLGAAVDEEGVGRLSEFKVRPPGKPFLVLLPELTGDQGAWDEELRSWGARAVGRRAPARQGPLAGPAHPGSFRPGGKVSGGSSGTGRRGGRSGVLPPLRPCPARTLEAPPPLDEREPSGRVSRGYGYRARRAALRPGPMRTGSGSWMRDGSSRPVRPP